MFSIFLTDAEVKVSILLSLTVVLLNFWSCAPHNSKLETALKRAGENRIELEKVLSRYSSNPADSLKYKAAVFLIENMPGYFYYEGKGISDYADYFAAIKPTTSEPKTVLDSLAKTLGRFTLKDQIIKYDIETLDSAYLCENIELAFESWRRYPWSRQYGFNDFCEYILPYRIGDETPTNWRSAFGDEYSSIIESVDFTSPIELAKLLRDSIIDRLGTPRFTMTRPSGYPTVDAITSQNFAGACDDLTQFSISLFRTFGIAAAEDIIPKRGDANVGHSWVAIFDLDGELYNTDFFGEILYVSSTMVNRASLKAKVFRRHFSSNDYEYEIFKTHNVEIPNNLFDFVYRSMDVTKLYANNLMDLRLQREQLYNKMSRPKIVFLCAPSWLEWTPIAWSKFDHDGGVTFKSVDGGSLLRVAYFDETGINFLSAPFYAHRQTRDLVFIPDADFNQVSNVTLYTKYGLYSRDLLFINRLLDGCFEGANDPKFINSDTLHVIKKHPRHLFTEVTVSSAKKYKYLRYKGSDSSFCNIAEIEFISKQGKLSGKIIGTPGAMDNNPQHEFMSAFDGRTETSVNHMTPGDGWTGIQLAKPATVTKIRYAPRNHDNFVKEGNDYELFVSTTDGWVSYGRKKSKSDSLVYQNVPKGALLYLKNHTEGQEERVFHIKDERQVFK